MFPWLRVMLVHLWAACIAGTVVTAGLALGYYDPATFVIAALAGVLLGVPAGLLNWIWLRPKRSREIGWTWPIAQYIRRQA